MNSLKTKRPALIASILLPLALILLFLLPLMAAAKEATGAASQPLATEAASLAETTVISGTYAGTVAITEPVALGVLDLVFDISDADGSLSGAVDVTRTLVYSGAPALRGSITGATDGITPTFRIDSEVFGGVVSGREVQRSFTLEGEALEDGDFLRGQYTEVISGFTPNALSVQGLFLVVRPSQPSDDGTPEPTVTPTPTGTPEPGATATATPTNTPEPTYTHFLYLPIVMKNWP